MTRYILKRLVLMIPIVLGISFIIFTIISVTPGDPVQLIMGADADPVLMEAKREEWGLNDNFLVRYANILAVSSPVTWAPLTVPVTPWPARSPSVCPRLWSSPWAALACLFWWAYPLV